MGFCRSLLASLGGIYIGLDAEPSDVHPERDRFDRIDITLQQSHDRANSLSASDAAFDLN